MSQLPNIQQNNEQILNDIQSLQQMEQQIINNLETNPNLTTDQQQKMVDKMNQLSNMRVNLYQTLSGINNYYQGALNSSVGTLQEQVVAIGIVESELNKSKEKLRILNKNRMVSEETRNKLRYANTGKKHSLETKLKISTLQKSSPRTIGEETRQKLRNAQIKLALGGNAVMLIWLGKQMLGQTDNPNNADTDKVLPWTDN